MTMEVMLLLVRLHTHVQATLVCVIVQDQREEANIAFVCIRQDSPELSTYDQRQNQCYDYFYGEKQHL